MTKHSARQTGKPTLDDFKSTPHPLRAGAAKTIGKTAHRPAKRDFPPRPRPVDRRAKAPESIGARRIGPPASAAFNSGGIYKKGWLAGMDDRIDGAAARTDGRADALNPGKGAVERARWMDGFIAAVKCRAAS